MEDLIAAVIDQIHDREILVVRLEVGRASGVMPEALSFCFDVCAHGTSLEGARLDIVETEHGGLVLKEVEVM